MNKDKAIDQNLPDEQGFAFIAFAQGFEPSPKVWVWSFCRDFATVYPKSPKCKDVEAIRDHLEKGFSSGKKRVVLHGHIAVLEPTPPSAKRQGNMVPVGSLGDALDASPSDWGLHRLLIVQLGKRNPPFDVNPAYPRFSKLYPGNEWPFLAEAAFQSRVHKNYPRALEFADNALTLNPGNAKAYAIRGMIFMACGKEPDKALADLTRAYGIDPASLGDEPESHVAISFLIEKALEVKEHARATEYLQKLGGLRVLGTDKQFKDTANYARLAKAAEAAGRDTAEP